MTSTTSELLVQIDGNPVPLLDCTWVLFTPCGCMAGATVTGFRQEPYASNVEIKATEQQAWAAMYENKLERDREQARGFTFRLVTYEQYGEIIKAGKCEHDPTWGVPPRPKPEGKTWAVSNSGAGIYPPKNARLHLVAVEHADEDFASRRESGWAKRPALCGSESTDWRAEWPHVDGHVDCTRCIKLAGGESA